MRTALGFMLMLLVTLVTVGCPNPDSESDESTAEGESASAEESPDEAEADENEGTAPAGRRAERLEAAIDEACNKAYDCAVERMPENVRDMLTRDTVCRGYQQIQSTMAIDAVGRDCFRATIDYLGCVGDLSCDELMGSENGPCPDAAAEAREKCNYGNE